MTCTIRPFLMANRFRQLLAPTPAYVVDGVRVVGFDNERGKGDHCHLDGMEVPYTFTGVEQLIEDFIAAVAARRAP